MGGSAGKLCLHIHGHGVCAEGAKCSEPQVLLSPQAVHTHRVIPGAFLGDVSSLLPSPSPKVFENVRCDGPQGRGRNTDTASDLMHGTGPFKNAAIIYPLSLASDTSRCLWVVSQATFRFCHLPSVLITDRNPCVIGRHIAYASSECACVLTMFPCTTSTVYFEKQ